MRIYLMRHGHALSCAEAGVCCDSQRPLSDSGVQEARETAGRLRARGARPQLTLCSPMLRAQSTAREVCAALNAPAPRVYKPLENLLPGAELMERVLRDKWAVSELLMVGHMPQLSEAAARLCAAPLQFMTAAAAAFESGEDGAWRLLWQDSPAADPS